MRGNLFGRDVRPALISGRVRIAWRCVTANDDISWASVLRGREGGGGERGDNEGTGPLKRANVPPAPPPGKNVCACGLARTWAIAVRRNR